MADVDGERRWTPAFPGPCAECQQRDVADDYALFGCGHRDQYAGKARAKRTRGATTDPTRSTCPWFYAEQPFVSSIFEDLADYKAGRLGNVCDLPAALVDYLRALAAEHADWESVQLDALAKKADH